MAEALLADQGGSSSSKRPPLVCLWSATVAGETLLDYLAVESNVLVLYRSRRIRGVKVLRVGNTQELRAARERTSPSTTDYI